MTAKTSSPLQEYVQTRAKKLGFSTTALCKQASISRQTLWTLGHATGRMPELETLVKLATALRVHPSELMHHAMLGFRPRPVKSPAQIARPDKSAFVADVTMPDGSMVMPGQRFTKTWAIQNVGQAPWKGRFLRCMDDDLVVMRRMPDGSLAPTRVTEALVPAVREVVVDDTLPGDTVQISVDFSAPVIDGTFFSYWKSAFADGTLCYPESVGLSVRVRVVDLFGGAKVHNRPNPAGA